MNKALLIGINAYPDAPLQGCINDVRDMAAHLTAPVSAGGGGFEPASIRMLVDARATTAAIRERLQWLVADARPGDRLLLHYSGHGVQMPNRSKSGEVDRLDEAICPYNFDWSDEHTIKDKDFHAIFAKLPPGTLTWISDSCHSGDLSRAMPRPGLLKARPRAKTLPMPADIAWRKATALAKGLGRKAGAPGWVHGTGIGGVLISGCRADETSADASFRGRSNGALTYFLLQALKKAPGAPLEAIVDATRKALRKAGYAQHPQLEGDLGMGIRGFLAPL